VSSIDIVSDDAIYSVALKAFQIIEPVLREDSLPIVNPNG